MTEIELDSQSDYDLDIIIDKETFEEDSVWVMPYE
jgi:hypothetical protein